MIGDAIPIQQLPPQWLALRVDHPDEVAPAVEGLTKNPDLHGVHLFPGTDMDLWKVFASRYLFVQAAGGVVLDEKGLLLVIRRLGRWDLPKGKVEPGESIPEAAVREVMEECGLDTLELGPLLAQTWHTYERKGAQHLKRTDWYQMRASSLQPLMAQSEEEIDEVRWIDHLEAGMIKADTYPSLLPVIAAWEDIVGR